MQDKNTIAILLIFFPKICSTPYINCSVSYNNKC